MNGRTEVIESTSAKYRHGSQAIEIPPIKVFLLPEATHAQRIENDQMDVTSYAVLFGSNKVIKALTIYVAKNKSHVDAIIGALGPFESETIGPVVKLLTPLFPEIDVSFLRRRSRTPTMVVATILAKNRYITFCFRVHRGAIRPAETARELSHTVRIEFL
jgi:hypothetical protein